MKNDQLLQQKVTKNKKILFKWIIPRKERIDKMDINVRTEIKQSEINGLFQEVEQLKKERIRMKETIDKKTEKIISHILKHGNVLAYKENTPHVLTVKNVEVKKFDKPQLAADLDITTRELNLIGVAELVESNRITSEKLKEYEFYENDQRLKATKAKKRDIELIYGGLRK